MRPSIQVLSDEDVFGEVTLAPYGLTGVSEVQLARTLSRPRPTKPVNPQAVPAAESSLTFRLNGLAALMRRTVHL